MKCNSCKFKLFCKHADDIKRVMESAESSRETWELPSEITVDIACTMFVEGGDEQ